MFCQTSKLIHVYNTTALNQGGEPCIVKYPNRIQKEIKHEIWNMTCKGLREHKNTNFGSNGFQIGYLARDYSHKT